jgi:photosystem II stability/assembly factor-like uncharacterized protein
MGSSRIRILLATLLVLAGAAGAIPPPWMPLGPFGGTVAHLTADPAHSGLLYATTGNGIYKTTDGGVSWTAVYIGVPSSNVAVDPAFPAILYAGVSGAVLIKSTDGGAHWAPSASGLTNGAARPLLKVAVDPSSHNRVLAMDGDKVWRSVDAGASWQLVSDGLPGDNASLLDLAVARRPAGTAFAATSVGVYRSLDGGASWRPAPGLPAAQAFSLAVAPSDPRTVYAYFGPGTGLYKTANGGNSWQPAGGSRDIGWFLAVSLRSPRTLYALSMRDDHLYRSADGGARWTLLSGPPPTAIAIAVDATRPTTVYAGVANETLGGVFRSDDEGTSWTRRSEGLTGLGTTAVAVDPHDSERLWTTAASALFRSANRGARWLRVRVPPPAAVSFPTGLAIGAASRVYANLPYPFGPRGPLVFALWRTADDGASWTNLVASSPTFINTERFEIAPSDLSTIYAVGPTPTTTRFFRSTNGGDTWEPRSTGGTITDPASGAPLPSCRLGDLAVAPSAANVVYLSGTDLHLSPFGCERSLIRSGDGGATWTVISAGLPLESVGSLAVDPRNPDMVYAGVGSRGLWKSTDGGQLWAQTGSALAGHAFTSLLASEVPDRLYAAVDGNRVFRSDDGGATWRSWSHGLRISSAFSLLSDPGDPRRIYAATANGVWVVTETD